MRYSHPPLLILLLLLTACQHSPSICSDEGHYAGWLFDGQGWTEERPIPYGARPGEPTFLTPEVVYDVKRETLVLLTGFGGQDVGSWAFDYDGVEWKTVVDNTSVSGINNLLGFFDLTYDFKRTLLFCLVLLMLMSK